MTSTPLRMAYRKYRAVAISTFVFSFVINLLLFVSPLYMMQVYDRVLGSRNETTLLMISLICLLMYIFYGLLEFVRSRMLVRVGIQFDDVLSSVLFSRAVKMRLSNPAGGAEYILSDGDKIREFLTGAGMLTICDIPWTPMFIVLAFLFHPWIGALSLFGAIVIFALALFNEYATKNSLKQANNAAQAANQFASTVLQNAEVIRSMGMEKALGERWRQKHESVLSAQSEASDKAGGILSFQKFFRTVIQSAILGLGAYLAVKQEMSAGMIIAASIVMGRALQPVEMAVSQWKSFIAARQAHERLTILFDNIPGDEQRIELPTPRGEIIVENLSSVIPGTRIPFLKNINFTIQPGEVLAVIGPSASGKSSLIRHIVGVWPALTGAVRIDGANISHWNADQLGQHIGYLPQEVRLFAGTIAENISRFSEGNPAEVIRAAQIAGAHELILQMPNGYETQAGDNGQNLSGGQRQRVGLARAIYGMPRIVILDEPNSNLDSDGETALAEAVKTLRQAKVTVILVTHKTNLLAVSDRILIMRDGTMQSFVTPQELLKSVPMSSPPVQEQIKPVSHPSPVTTILPVRHHG